MYKSTLMLVKFCYTSSFRSHRYHNLSNWAISQPNNDGFSSNLDPLTPFTP